jgi:hypothetical protein
MVNSGTRLAAGARGDLAGAVAAPAVAAAEVARDFAVPAGVGLAFADFDFAGLVVAGLVGVVLDAVAMPLIPRPAGTKSKAPFG